MMQRVRGELGSSMLGGARVSWNFEDWKRVVRVCVDADLRRNLERWVGLAIVLLVRCRRLQDCGHGKRCGRYRYTRTRRPESGLFGLGG
jgi:hypothetical protein